MGEQVNIDKSKKSHKLKQLIAGIEVGFGSIIPGVSGAVMAVSLGIYYPMIDALAGLRKQFKKNFLFLFPIGVGVIIGLISGAVLLDWLIVRYLAPLLYFFIGLIGGGVPSLIKEANGKGFKKRYLFALLGGALLASGLIILERIGAAGTPVTEGLGIFQSLIAGFIIAAGAIIPGISTSFILIYLGWYTAVIEAFTHLDFLSIAFIVLGIIICAASIIKLVRWLFARHYGYAYYAVLGFLLISIVLICLPLISSTTNLWMILLIIPGFIIAYLFSRKLIVE